MYENARPLITASTLHQYELENSTVIMPKSSWTSQEDNNSVIEVSLKETHTQPFLCQELS